MVLTRRQTKELQEREKTTHTSHRCPLDPLDPLDPDTENVVDTATGGTPRRCVLQTRNIISSKGMQGSARKGLQSWPLGAEREQGSTADCTVGQEQNQREPVISSHGGYGSSQEKDLDISNDPEAASAQGMPASALAAPGPLFAPALAPALAPAVPQRNTPPRAAGKAEVRLPTGTEPTDISLVDLYPVRASFVPYTADELPTTTSSIVEGIVGTNWLAQVNAMNRLRRLVAHHGVECDSLLNEHSARIFPAVIKAIKSPRSNVSKSAIMTVRDLFELSPQRMGAELQEDPALKNMNGLLMVLLTKAASNDKKFVVDEAVGALDCMCDSIEASIVLKPILSGSTEHKNPKVRGRCFVLLRSLIVNSRDLDDLLSGEGALVSIVAACDRGTTDNTPEARECAREVMRVVFKEGGSDVLRRCMEEALAAGNDAGEGEGSGTPREIELRGEWNSEGNGTLSGAECGAGSHGKTTSLLERFVAIALGNNRGKAVLLLDKCKI